jgi:LysR family glycine cleavage system transcriptional activator
MRRRLPPFPALRAFEAAARLGSFRAAGEELCVTSSAISHQIRKLEENLGKRLFERGAHGPEINPTGLEYLHRVTPILDNLEAQTDELFSTRSSDSIAVKGTPGFISRWLVPRLDRLLAATGLEVRLTTGLPPTDFSTGDVDVIIQWEDDPVDGVVVEPFLSSPKIAVAAPEYVQRFESLKNPADLSQCCLMREEFGDCWDEWLDICGVSNTVSATGPTLGHCELLLTAAERTQGVALAYAALVEFDILSGRLIRLFPQQTKDKLIFSVTYLENRRHNRKIRAFRDWIISEVQNTAETYALVS